MRFITNRTRKTHGGLSLRKISLLGLLVLAANLAGCTFEAHPVPPFFTPPVPKVNSIDFYPQYFCSGDEITVTWDTENIDKIELRNNAGEVKLSTVSPSGTLTTAPIEASDLPLVARGYVGDDHQDHAVENLVNIDDPTWTNAIPSSREVVVPNSRREVFAYNDTVTLADGTVQQIPVYEVYLTYSGLQWAAGNGGTIPSFATKAKIDKIRNIAGPTLEFSSYTSGSATIAENSEGDINPDWPSSIASFGGTYLEPKEEFFAWQYGEIKKPPDEWFYVDQVYQQATGIVSLLVYCDVP